MSNWALQLTHAIAELVNWQPHRSEVMRLTGYSDTGWSARIYCKHHCCRFWAMESDGFSRPLTEITDQFNAHLEQNNEYV